MNSFQKFFIDIKATKMSQLTFNFHELNWKVIMNYGKAGIFYLK